MEKNTKNNISVNPLSDLISDDIYFLLDKKGLINEKSVRDHLIRKKFAEFKSQNFSASEAIEKIRTDYPYLQFDTIRKIVYQLNK
ncbi:MAG TPA: hypothetical protein PLZ15_00010 [Melioribacteraceae bacterium]|nr:hypothetical protein [Melioribacteraceae bacterium]